MLSRLWSSSQRLLEYGGTENLTHGSVSSKIVTTADDRLSHHNALWCNGNTNDSDSFVLGSNPGRAAQLQ